MIFENKINNHDKQTIHPPPPPIFQFRLIRTEKNEKRPDYLQSNRGKK